MTLGDCLDLPHPAVNYNYAITDSAAPVSRQRSLHRSAIDMPDHITRTSQIETWTQAQDGPHGWTGMEIEAQILTESTAAVSRQRSLLRPASAPASDVTAARKLQYYHDNTTAPASQNSQVTLAVRNAATLSLIHI